LSDAGVRGFNRSYVLDDVCTL